MSEIWSEDGSIDAATQPFSMTTAKSIVTTGFILSGISQITPNFGKSVHRCTAMKTACLPQPSDGLILDFQGADECRLMAMSRHPADHAARSASRSEADVQIVKLGSRAI